MFLFFFIYILCSIASLALLVGCAASVVLSVFLLFASVVASCNAIYYKRGCGGLAGLSASVRCVTRDCSIDTDWPSTSPPDCLPVCLSACLAVKSVRASQSESESGREREVDDSIGENECVGQLRC